MSPVKDLGLLRNDFSFLSVTMVDLNYLNLLLLFAKSLFLVASDGAQAISDTSASLMMSPASRRKDHVLKLLFAAKKHAVVVVA